MVFANFSRTEHTNQIFLSNSTPIQNIKKIKFYTDDSSGSFTKKEFKWSFNNSYWSSWTVLNQGNISNISMNSNANLFIEIRYTRINATSNVTKFSIDYISTDTSSSMCPVPKTYTKVVTPVSTKKIDPINPLRKEVYYKDFVKTTESNTITFTSRTPIINPKRLLYYKDDSVGVFIKKELKWSFDNNYWSSWTPLNQGNVTNINTNNSINMFMSIRYIKSGVSSDVNVFGVGYIKSISSLSPKTPTTPVVKIPVSKPNCSIPAPVYKPNTPAPIANPSIINADTLDCKPGSHYLWRPNHKGQQAISTITDLETILEELRQSDGGIEDALNVEGDGIGVYYSTENNKIYFKTLIEGKKVFLSENETGNITIDMDDASINDLYSLIGSIEGVNIGTTTGSFGEVYKQKSGEVLEFRTIVSGDSGVVVSTVGDQVRISIDSSAAGTPIWTDPDPVSADVGGVSGGDTIPLDNNSIEILEQILYEYFPPEVTDLLPESGYFEKYVNDFDVNLTGSFDTNKSPKTVVDSAELFINGSSSVSYPTIYYPPNTRVGTFNWHVAGDPLYSNRVYTVKLANHYSMTPDVMPSKDVSIFIDYVNPYFFGIVGDEVNVNNITGSDISNLDKIIVNESSNLITYDVSLNHVKVKFLYAYDAAYSDVNSIFDVKNNFNVTTSFDKGTVLVDNGSQTNIPYKFYIKNHWISFTPDVSVFKLNFDI